MNNIDERYETLYEQWEVAGQPMGSFAMFIFAEYENTFEENRKLRKFVKNIEWGLDEINNKYKEIKKVIE